MWARLEAEARKSDLDLDLSKQRFSYPTARAHTLIRHAAAKGTQGALVHALYRANFQEARNIHDPAVLADVAAPHGFTEDEVTRLTNDEGELAATREEAAGGSGRRHRRRPAVRVRRAPGGGRRPARNRAPERN